MLDLLNDFLPAHRLSNDSRQVPITRSYRRRTAGTPRQPVTVDEHGPIGT